MSYQRLEMPEASDAGTGWARELTCARECARSAADLIRDDFGRRAIISYKGPHDVLLRGDLEAQDRIVDRLISEFPDHRVVAEEGMQDEWPVSEYTWVVDPLDGTNNFGYGIAHCAIAISLFRWDTAVLAVVFDPIVDRWFVAAEDLPLASGPPPHVGLEQATISLVSGYSAAARRCASDVGDHLAQHCKRVCSLWAPALDLALVATGRLDGMVCIGASFLDVCAGMFLVHSAGGTLLDMEGRAMVVQRSLHARPVTFVAARTRSLAGDLFDRVRGLQGG
jgi:myo-inositol-1(or 4)-monophosphatase